MNHIGMTVMMISKLKLLRRSMNPPHPLFPYHAVSMTMISNKASLHQVLLANEEQTMPGAGGIC